MGWTLAAANSTFVSSEDFLRGVGHDTEKKASLIKFWDFCCNAVERGALFQLRLL